MALSKDLKQELVRVDADPHYPLFGDILQSEDYTLYASLGSNYELYEDLELDCHISSTTQKRKLAVVARNWTVEPADNARSSKDAADFIKTALGLFNFDEACLHLLNAILLGHAEAEIMWSEEAIDGKTFYVPGEILGKNTSRFHFIKPEAGKINAQNQQVKGYEIRQLTRNSPLKGEPLPINKILHHSYGSKTGNPNGNGLGSKLYWMRRFKTELTKHWLIFCDKFAQPTPYGKYPAGGSKAELEVFLATISTGSWAALPEGYTIALLEAARSGTVSTYEGFLAWCDAQISKAVLGETLTTELGSVGSQAAANTHNDVRKELGKADADLLSYSLKEFLLKPLITLNMPKAKVPSVWRVFDEDEDLNQRAARDSQLFQMGFRLTLEKVVEVYGDGYMDTQATQPGDDLSSLLGDTTGAAAGDTPPDATAPATDTAAVDTPQASDTPKDAAVTPTDAAPAASFAVEPIATSGQILSDRQYAELAQITPKAIAEALAELGAV